MRRLLPAGLCATLCLPGAAAPVVRPSPPPFGAPTLHLLFIPRAHPASVAKAALPDLSALTPTPAVPLIFPLAPAAAPALPTPAVPAALPVPSASARLPVRAALETAGAALSEAPPAGAAASAALGALFEAGRRAPAAEADPAFLAVRRAADARLLDRALAEARRSKTARKVLARAEAALAEPMKVEVRALGGNLGEYDYMAGVLRLDRALLERDPGQAAATLVHELVHVLQHREGVPAEALELELEAHIVSMAVSSELGLALTSFEAAAARELAKGPRAYADWMAGQLPGKVRLVHRSLAEAREHLELEVDDLETASRVSTERIDWARSDLALLKSRKGRAAYRAFAERVLRLMKKAAAGYNLRR